MANAKSASKKAPKQNSYTCHDCGCQVKIKDDKIVGGKMLAYQSEEGKIFIVKCNACYKKNRSLTDFKDCEVYSRIVGYLRPEKQWNAGKQQEFEERKVFKIPGSCGC